MTKTAAAKRFADEYGIYSSRDDRYTPLSTYQSRNVTEVRPGFVRITAYTDALDDVAAARKRHTADLKIIMALLGVEDQYEDTVEMRPTFVREGVYFGATVDHEVVTKSATQKFAEDLRAAQSAVEGQAALKRIRKAIKTVTKEESK